MIMTLMVAIATAFLVTGAAHAQTFHPEDGSMRGEVVCRKLGSGYPEYVIQDLVVGARLDQLAVEEVSVAANAPVLMALTASHSV